MNQYLSHMKVCLPAFFTFIILFHFQSFSQKEEKFILKLDDDFLEEKQMLPFSTIQVIDARFEQGNVGCVVEDVSFKGLTENKMLATFSEQLKTYLPKVLNTLFLLQKDKNDTLVIVVKQFRIADYFSNSSEKQFEPASVISFSCSFYKGENNRLIKISSSQGVLSQKWEMTETNAKQITAVKRKKAIQSLLVKLFQNRNWTPTETSFALSEVQEGIKKRFQVPIWHDSVLSAGVYKSYKDFLNNSPSLSDFKIGRYLNEIKEVRDANSNLLDFDSFWGLCDGKNVYINFLGHLFQLYPVGNSYCIVYSRTDKQKIIPIGEGLSVHYLNNPGKGFTSPTRLINSFKKNVRPELLYLNMDNGTVHVEELIGENDIRKLKTWF